MKLTQAILPVAGLGTRFLPWTKAVPKELLPLGNEPIIARIVDECIAAGITDICFVISKGKEAIPQYFAPHPELEAELKQRGKSAELDALKKYNQVRFHTVYQDNQLGDGHAILQAKHWVTSDHVAILFGDDLFVGAAPGIAQLASAYDQIKESDAALIALQNIPKEHTNRYGIVEVATALNDRLKKLQGMVEKPQPETAPSTLGIVGRYIIPRSTLDVLPSVQSGKDGEIRLIDALIAQIQSGTAVYGYECEGDRIDTGTPDGYKDALKYFA